MYRNSLKMIKIDQNMSELWQTVCKDIIVKSPHLLVSLYELFINADTINIKITKNNIVLTVFYLLTNYTRTQRDV